MNQTFSFQRWSLLVAKHWAENRRRYLLSVVAFMSLIMVWYVFVMLIDTSNPMAEGLQQVTYFFCLFIVGPFYASQFFKPLSAGPKAIDYLTVPASNLEKAVCGIFYGLILFPLAFTAAFYVVDIITVAIANLFHPSYNGGAQGVAHKAYVASIFEIDGTSDKAPYYVFLLFFSIQSAYLLGSVYFAQYSYIKTTISLSLACLVVAFVGFYLTSRFMPRGGFYESPVAYQVFIDDGLERRVVALPKWVGEMLKYLFLYSFLPIFWITTYFRLKEKEV